MLRNIKHIFFYTVFVYGDYITILITLKCSSWYEFFHFGDVRAENATR